MVKQSQGQGLRLGDLESKWREFNSRLDIFNDKIESQKNRLREEIDKRAKQTAAEVEKMYDRWQQAKPKERSQLTFEDALEISQGLKGIRE